MTGVALTALRPGRGRRRTAGRQFRAALPGLVSRFVRCYKPACIGTEEVSMLDGFVRNFCGWLTRGTTPDAVAAGLAPVTIEGGA